MEQKVHVDTFMQLKYSVKKINQWYRKSKKALNIITTPYNSTSIFEELIESIIKDDKKVLYVWNSNERVEELHKKFKHKYKNICFSQFENIVNIKDKYDLVILDDVSKYSKYTKQELIEFFYEAEKISSKIILTSVESINIDSEELVVIPLSRERIFIEPRIINTRIDLNKDIPYSLYEYLKWFKDTKKNIILLVPDKEKIEVVYNYYVNTLKFDGVNVIKENDIILKNNVLNQKDKAIFIVSSSVEVKLKNSTINGVVVLFSDDVKYTYKKLLYVCGYIRNENKELSEVLLVSKSTSEDMEMVKKISRYFNKYIWEVN